MYHDQPPLSLRAKLGRIAAVAVLALAFGLLVMWATDRIGRDLNAQGEQSLKSTILRTAVQCYAVEGSYPASLDYLTENYGLQINKDRYLVIYEAAAANELPQVKVVARYVPQV